MLEQDKKGEEKKATKEKKRLCHLCSSVAYGGSMLGNIAPVLNKRKENCSNVQFSM